MFFKGDARQEAYAAILNKSQSLCLSTPPVIKGKSHTMFQTKSFIKMCLNIQPVEWNDILHRP